jgi:hypothetical protein
MMWKNRTLFVLLACLFIAFSAGAQESRATIQGTVKDPSGAIVPDAVVSATNTATGVTVTSKSNHDGIFQIQFLNPGTYDIVAQSPGFKKYIRSGYQLDIAEKAKLDINMDLGQASETVTVSGATPLLEPESATTDLTIENKTIVDAPISGGDVATLTLLSPGVSDVAIANHPYELTSVNVASRMVVAGVRSQNTEFTIDGTPAMETDSAGYTPPSDLVQEVKTEVNGYDASQGHSVGGYFNTVTKPGTNQLHGTLYEFHTDAALMSMNLFQRNQYNNPATGTLTSEKYKSIKGKDVNNRFGGSLGGPVIIPHLYNGRERTFWTAGYEGFRHISTDANSGSYFTVPTAAERQGDLSALLPLGCPSTNLYNSATGLCANGSASTYQIYDPFSTQPAGNGIYSRTPFAFNQIPSTLLDKTAQNILSYYPLPNSPPTSAAGANNFFHPVRGFGSYDVVSARIDQNFTQRDRAFLSGTWGTSNGYDQYSFSNAATDDIGSGPHIAALNADNLYIFNPSTLFDIHYGVVRRSISGGTPQVDLTAFGVPASVVAEIPQQARVFPRITMDGSNFTQAGAVAPTDGPNTTYQSLIGNVTKTFGRHSFNFGADFRIYQTNNYTLSNSEPYLTFAGTYTNGPYNTSATATVGQGLASFLLGIPSSGTIVANSSYAYTSRYYAGYVQDNFKIRSNLTLTAGIRYEYETAPTERFNRSVKSFDATAPNPVAAAAIAQYNANPIPQIPAGQFQVNGGLTFAGVNGTSKSLWATDNNNFAPRLGLILQLDPQTVVRGGYGVFYMPKGADRFGSAQDRNSISQMGFSQTTTITPSSDNGQTYTATLDNLFPNGILQPTGASAGLATGDGGSISYYNPKQINPLIQRWSFGIQRTMPKQILMDIEYLGTSGMHLGVAKQQDPIPRQYLSTSSTRDNTANSLLNSTVANPFYPLLPGTSLSSSTVARHQLLMPYPEFTSITFNDPVGSSIYHGLAVTVVRHFSSGFSVAGSYTWSKFLQSTEFLNASDPLPTKVISDQDFPERVAVSTIYDLPFGEGRRFGNNWNGFESALGGGWQFSVIWQAQSGPALGFGDALLQPNANFKSIELPNSKRNITQWFNTAAFDTVSSDQLVDNVITFPVRLPNVRGPGIDNANVSAMKYFKIHEGLKLQFRCEMMNAGNHSQLAAPNTTVTNTAFGSINSVQSVARQIFFAGKIIF